MRSWSATPWRFSAADYLQAVTHGAAGRRRDLDGAMVEASWDTELARAMAAHGLAVAEEGMVETLLLDLVQPT